MTPETSIIIRTKNEEKWIGEWARYWFARGYVAVKSVKFSVYHSHGLGLRALRAQWKYWASLAHPRPFAPLAYRKKRAS